MTLSNEDIIDYVLECQALLGNSYMPSEYSQRPLRMRCTRVEENYATC